MTVLNLNKNIKQEPPAHMMTKTFFVIDLLLFPVATYFYLPGTNGNSSGPWKSGPATAISLLLLLLGSAFLQILFPSIGRLWMAMPVISALVIIYFNRLYIKRLPSLQFTSISKKNIRSIVILTLFIFVLQISAELNLLDLKNQLGKSSVYLLHDLPLWQDMIIAFIGITTILTIYLMRTTATISINQIIILYACYTSIVSAIVLIFAGLTRMLNVNTGFLLAIVSILLAAVLSRDIIDVQSFGAYLSRFFFRILPKGLNFIFLWVCFLGLPQQVASVYSSYYYNRIYPIPGENITQNLIFTDRDRFKSGHQAAKKARYLYSKIFLTENWNALEKMSEDMDNNANFIYPNGDDIYLLNELSKSRNFKFNPVEDIDIPISRPIQSSWDVFLYAITKQGLLTNTDELIARFKTNLPDASKGNLPEIESFHEANFVSLATEIPIYFLPPSFEYVKSLLKNDIVPIILLYLSGKPLWAAIVTIDFDNSVVLVRTETTDREENSIKKIFDSNRDDKYKNEIMSRQITILPIEYVKSLFSNTSSPIIIFTDKKELLAMNLILKNEELKEIKRAIGNLHDPQNIQSSGLISNTYQHQSEYAKRINSIAKIKYMIQPQGLDYELFPNPEDMSLGLSRKDRHDYVAATLKDTKLLSSRDQIDISYKLINNDNVYSNKKLFVSLAKTPPVFNNLIDCDEAFTIGKQLFLSGYHKESLPYLELASKRHPFSSSYEIWYHIALLKNDKHVPLAYSDIKSKEGMWLYYQTLRDIKSGDSATAFLRLEKNIRIDSHNSLANQLLYKYFNSSLDDDYFMIAPEGL